MKQHSRIALIFLSAIAIITGFNLFLFNGHNISDGIITAGVVGVLDVTRGRAAYERIKEVASRINAVYKAAIIVNEDYFLSEQVITNVNSYTFETWDKVMQTTIKDRPLQRGVKDNDVFIAIGARLTIDNRVEKQSNVKPQTFPSPVMFAGTGAADGDDLWSVFNGEWSLEVGRTVYIPNEATRKFMLVPEFQQNDPADNFSQFDGSRYLELDPYAVLSGRSDNKLELDLKLYTGWDGEAPAPGEGDPQTENVITFEFTGLTAQNGAGYVEYFTGEADIFEEYNKKFPAQKS